ncbi:MAG: hypothetical protein R3C45_02080 [Phycisphaerales bacterium]
MSSKWYRWAHLRQGDRILHPSHNRDIWPDGLATKQRTLRIEWMQFRFNPQSDDIEPLTKPRELRQRELRIRRRLPLSARTCT